MASMTATRQAAETVARSSQPGTNRFARLSLLATAFAGQRVGVVEDGASTHFDGAVIRIVPLAPPDLHAATIVQAALIGAGTFSPRVMRSLVGRPRTTRRYFELEVARATERVREQLPRRLADALRPFWTQDLTGSAEASLARAAGSEPVPNVPAFLGSIHPAIAVRNGHKVAASAARSRTGDERLGTLQERTAESTTEESRPSLVVRAFRSPLGRASSRRRLTRLVGSRQSGPRVDGGAPGCIDAALGARNQRRPGAAARTSIRASVRSSHDDDHGVLDGRYPEWDTRTQTYRAGWCTVGDYDVASDTTAAAPARPIDRTLVRGVAKVGLDLQTHRRQGDGDALDVDALVEREVERAAGDTGHERIHQRRLPTGRDLCVVTLLDTSGSTADEAAEGEMVFDLHRALASDITAAFDKLGARTSLFGFNGYGRASVRLLRVKDLDDQWATGAVRRLASLEPTGFTRLGAAIRHATHLTSRAGTGNRLLVVVSDGFVYDEGYEGRYAEGDSARAVSEAWQRGTAVVAVGAAGSGAPERLGRIFGGHVVAVEKTSDLADQARRVLPPAVRAASRQQRWPTATAVDPRRCSAGG